MNTEAQKHRVFNMYNMRNCYLSRNYKNMRSAGSKAKTDMERIWAEEGFVNLGLAQTRSDNKVYSFFRTLASVCTLCFRIRRGDVLFLQYPFKKYFAFVCNVAHRRGARVVTLIHDLGSFRRKKLTVPQEIARLSHADALITLNDAMADWLRAQGCQLPMTSLGIWDYLSDARPVPRETMPAPPYSVLYAGSLVPRELTLCAKPGATVRSSASMNLEEQFALMKEFYDRGQFVVRLHTGDPCIYGAIQEQMNYFDRYGMSYHITPGISSFQAAAAALRSQFTIPEKVQSIILTRGEGRTPMPEREKLHLLAQSQSTMCIFLSAGIVEQVQAELLQAYPPTTPVAVCYHLTWKDERIFRGNLGELAKLVRDNHLTLTTLIVVGDAIDNREGLSRLYADEFKHLYRH